MKRTIYHSNISETRKGRIINALLAFLTANRYSVIFTFKITIVKRDYQLEGMRKRAKENLFIAIILFPLAMAITMGLQKCQQPRFIQDRETETSAEKDSTDASAGALVHPLHEAQGAQLPLLHSTID